MKIAKIEDLHCDAGWRHWTFVKVSTDEGVTGYSETGAARSSWAVAGCIRDLEPFLVGKDPLPYGLEANRTTLNAFLQYAFEQGVCHRRLEPEELFPAVVHKSFKV